MRHITYRSGTYMRCALCEMEIEQGDEYISNGDGEHAHLECLCDIQDTLEFLGVEVEVAQPWYGEI